MTKQANRMTFMSLLKTAGMYVIVTFVLTGCIVSCKRLFSTADAPPKKEHDAAYYQPPAGYKDTLEYRKRESALTACTGLNSNTKDAVACMRGMGY